MEPMSLDKVYEYMHQKKAEIVVENVKTGVHKRYKSVLKGVAGVWWIYLIRKGEKDIYLGYIRGDLYIPGDDVDVKEENDFHQIYLRIVRKIDHPNLRISHTGICSVCSRKLTDPDSIQYGIGPECRKNIGYAYD